MTSIKFHYRPSTKIVGQEGKLFIRLIHRRRSRTIPTGYIIRMEEWNKDTGTIRLPGNGSGRYEYLRGIEAKISKDIHRLKSLVSTLSERGEYDVEDVVNGFKGHIVSNTIAGYCERVCLKLEESGQERTARAYRSAVRSLEKFLSNRILRLSDLNARTIKAYEAYLLEQGLFLNTISFYMRQLRAIYNRAVREKLLRRQEEKPFENVFTGVYKTRRRALTEDELNVLASLELKLNKRMGVLKKDYEANRKELQFYGKLKKSLFLFLFCFHARGMSFVDIAYLKKSDVGKDSIIYKRKKTGRFLEVGITAPMREIMEWFAAEVRESPYVFPIIDPIKVNTRRQYENGLRQQNELLGILAKIAGLDKKVTTHVSRHTWATIAKWRQVSVTVISEALGHRDFKTTEHYLASFNQSVLDKLSGEMSGIIKNRGKAA